MIWFRLDQEKRVFKNKTNRVFRITLKSLKRKLRIKLKVNFKINLKMKFRKWNR